MINANHAMWAVLMKMAGYGLNVVELSETVLLTDGAPHDKVMD
jgi:hypothetical protein